MHKEKEKRKQNRIKRQLRVRKTLRGTEKKPRLSVFKSNVHIAAQVIDDDKGATLVGFGSHNKTMRSAKAGKSKTELATLIGKELAEKLKQAGVEQVVFDRGPYKYHGVIAALADAVREAGIKL